MKRLSHFIFSATTLLTLSFTSCGGDDDNYSPGTEVSNDCPVVYFSSENESEIFVTPEDNSLSVKMMRRNTKGAVTVPVVVDSKTATLNIPESVSFADGEGETELVVTYSEFEGGMNFKVHVPEEYTDPYAILPGSAYYSTSLAQLNKVSGVEYWSSNGTFNNVSTSVIYSYVGENKFLWKNFFGSGKDLVFTVDTKHSGSEFDPNDIQSLAGDIIPVTNYTNVEGDTGWFFTNGVNTGDYFGWTPDGSTLAITNTYFYYYSTTYDYSYSYIDFYDSERGYGQGWFYYNYLNDYSVYDHIYFYLDY